MDNVVEFSLGDLDGWQAMVEYDPALAGGVYRVHTIAFEYDGQRAMFTTYYGPEGYDPDTIWQVVSSLTLPS
jgi:hypothetical protein